LRRRTCRGTRTTVAGQRREFLLTAAPLAVWGGTGFADQPDCDVLSPP